MAADNFCLNFGDGDQMPLSCMTDYQITLMVISELVFNVVLLGTGCIFVMLVAAAWISRKDGKL